MIKNFLFVIQRFKTSAVLNIVGLSVAFAVFTVTMIQCRYDFSYNRNFKKAKEIAIRRVNGSTINEIILMLNRNVLIQMAVAFAVATPSAYFIVRKWLENFACKTPIYWWIFMLGGLIVLIITLLTVSLQSYRAAKTNPVKTLNSE
jgi:putative ABC transport system permease protein